MGQKLAVFDIDGTIANHGVLDQGALAGIRHLQSQGYITTLCTGRGYRTLKLALGDHFDEVVSDKALLILEHGTKITDKLGNVVFAEYLGSEEINHIIDFLRANISIVKIIWSHPENPSNKDLMWCINASVMTQESPKRSGYANLFTGSFGQLRTLLLEEKLTSVGAKMNPHVQVHNLKLAFTRSPINVIFQDGNIDFLRNNTNKGLAILYLMKHLQCEYGDVLVAGNAINDVEMLNLAVGKRILVGPEVEREALVGYLSEQADLVHVATPHALGNYLQRL